MSEMTVRTFRAGDAAVVSKLMIAAFRSFLKDKLTDSLQRYLTADSLARGSRHRSEDAETAAFVAVDGARVVGYIKVSASATGLGSLEVVGVDPEYFGRRVGDLLMKRAVRFWRGWKQRKISTCVSSHNRKALLYYIRNGFVPEGFRPDHFIEGVHEIPLGRFLTY
jgi:ribosomal protein S18 acetylase RimI-like enzyme